MPGCQAAPGATIENPSSFDTDRPLVPYSAEPQRRPLRWNRPLLAIAAQRGGLEGGRDPNRAGLEVNSGL